MNSMDTMQQAAKVGFKYTVEQYRNGELIDSDVNCNLIPTQGLNHILSVLLKAGVQTAAWYIGIYEGNYIPVASVTGSTIVAAATECVAYTEAARPAWVGGAISNGFVSNEASRASFTINATKAVYGAFMVSGSVKSGGSDVLISAVRFSTVKNVEAGDILRVRAEFTTVSAT